MTAYDDNNELDLTSPPNDCTVLSISALDSMLWVATDTGLWRRTGTAWNLLPAPFADQSVAALVPTDASTRRLLVAGLAYGVQYSSDGGEQWYGSWLDEIAGGDTCFAVSPSFATDRFILAGTEHNVLLRSVDAGRIWQLRSAEVAVINIVWVDPHDPLLLVAGTADGTLLRSVDTGANWECSWSGPDAVLAFAGNSDGLYAGLYQGGLLLSLDRGRSWQRESVTASVLT